MDGCGRLERQPVEDVVCAPMLVLQALAAGEDPLLRGRSGEAFRARVAVLLIRRRGP